MQVDAQPAATPVDDAKPNVLLLNDDSKRLEDWLTTHPPSRLGVPPALNNGVSSTPLWVLAVPSMNDLAELSTTAAADQTFIEAKELADVATSKVVQIQHNDEIPTKSNGKSPVKSKKQCRTEVQDEFHDQIMLMAAEHPLWSQGGWTMLVAPQHIDTVFSRLAKSLASGDLRKHGGILAIRARMLPAEENTLVRSLDNFKRSKASHGRKSNSPTSPQRVGQIPLSIDIFFSPVWNSTAARDVIKVVAGVTGRMASFCKSSIYSRLGIRSGHQLGSHTTLYNSKAMTTPAEAKLWIAACKSEDAAVEASGPGPSMVNDAPPTATSKVFSIEAEKPSINDSGKRELEEEVEGDADSTAQEPASKKARCDDVSGEPQASTIVMAVPTLTADHGQSQVDESQDEPMLRFRAPEKPSGAAAQQYLPTVAEEKREHSASTVEDLKDVAMPSEQPTLAAPGVGKGMVEESQTQMEPVVAPAITAVTKELPDVANGSDDRQNPLTASETVETTEQKPVEVAAKDSEVGHPAELSVPSMDHVSDVTRMGLLKEVEATQEKLIEATKAAEPTSDVLEVTSSSTQPEQQSKDEAQASVSAVEAQQQQPSQQVSSGDAAAAAAAAAAEPSEASDQVDVQPKEAPAEESCSQQAARDETAPTAEAPLTSEPSAQVDVHAKDALAPDPGFQQAAEGQTAPTAEPTINTATVESAGPLAAQQEAKDVSAQEKSEGAADASANLEAQMTASEAKLAVVADIQARDQVVSEPKEGGETVTKAKEAEAHIGVVLSGQDGQLVTAELKLAAASSQDDQGQLEGSAQKDQATVTPVPTEAPASSIAIEQAKKDKMENSEALTAKVEGSKVQLAESGIAAAPSDSTMDKVNAQAAPEAPTSSIAIEQAEGQEIKTAEAQTVTAEESEVKSDEAKVDESTAATENNTEKANAHAPPKAPVSSTATEQDKVNETKASDSQAVKSEPDVHVPDNATSTFSADLAKVKATEVSVSSTSIEQSKVEETKSADQHTVKADGTSIKVNEETTNESATTAHAATTAAVTDSGKSDVPATTNNDQEMIWYELINEDPTIGPTHKAVQVEKATQ